MLQPLARKLVSLAAECQDTDLWERVPSLLSILVSIPGREHPVAVGVVGADEIELKICLMIDEHAAENMAEMLDQNSPDDDRIFARAHMVGLRLSSSNDVTSGYRRVLKEGGYRARGGRLTPHFVVNCHNEGWRPIKQGEARLLALCMHAILRAEEGNAFVRGMDMQGTLRLTLSSDTIEGKNTPDVSWDQALPDVTGGIVVRPDTSWVAKAWQVEPLDPDGDNDSQLLVLLDIKTDILVTAVFVHGRSKEASEDAFDSISRGLSWWPETLVIQPPWLHANLGEKLDAAGVDAKGGELPESVAQELDLIRGHYARRFRMVIPGDAERGALAGDAVDLPLTSAPRCVEAWSEVVDSTVEQLNQDVPADQRQHGMTAYWGSAEAVEAVKDMVRRNGADAAFDDWLVIDDRAAEGGLSRVEAARERPMASAGPAGAALDALAKSTLSIFRISTEGAGRLDLEDIATGEALKAFCGTLFWPLTKSIYIPMRVLELNGHRICRMAGPGLGAPIMDSIMSNEDGILDLIKGGRENMPGTLFGAMWRRESQGSARHTSGSTGA